MIPRGFIKRLEKLEKEKKDIENMSREIVDKEKRDKLVRSIAPFVFEQFQLPSKTTDNGDMGTFVFIWEKKNNKSVTMTVTDVGYDVTISTGTWFVSSYTVIERALETLGKALDVMNQVPGYKSLLKEFPRIR